CVIGSSTRIGSGARIGNDVKIFHGASIAMIPQDLKFGGESTELRVGDRTVIREFTTLNRGTRELGYSAVGSDCLIMAYAHVAHDCVLGDRVIVANAVQLGGHVHIGDWAILGGAVVVHQFSLIGEHAMIGGGFRVTQDVPPYAVVAGYPARVVSVNRVGLERRGFKKEQLDALSRAFRLLYRSKFNTKQAIAKLREDGPHTDEVKRLLAFYDQSERGVMR
ncbi:MAG: acyl-ACP--UDP-N-acetylglucosamine O-acyltransferase, partial [candidate division Zixibacteria bacterium]|nr:acyl-ACP--UDP-N-acetylglucosamine O-acyltransferase [candidate division Zixibacteria bacterium]